MTSGISHHLFTYLSATIQGKIIALQTLLSYKMLELWQMSEWGSELLEDVGT